MKDLHTVFWELISHLISLSSQYNHDFELLFMKIQSYLINVSQSSIFNNRTRTKTLLQPCRFGLLAMFEILLVRESFCEQKTNNNEL